MQKESFGCAAGCTWALQDGDSRHVSASAASSTPMPRGATKASLSHSCVLKFLPGRRNLWVSDTFESRPQARPSQPANPMPDMRGFSFFVFEASCLLNQIALPSKRNAVTRDFPQRASQHHKLPRRGLVGSSRTQP